LKENKVPGLLDEKEGRRGHVLLSKRWHLSPPFRSNELASVQPTFPQDKLQNLSKNFF
jgi:hypothetical protein